MNNNILIEDIKNLLVKNFNKKFLDLKKKFLKEFNNIERIYINNNNINNDDLIYFDENLNKYTYNLIKKNFKILWSLSKKVKNIDEIRLYKLNDDLDLKYLDYLEILNEKIYELTFNFSKKINNEMALNLTDRINKDNFMNFQNIILKLLKQLKNNIDNLNINFINDVRKMFL